MPYHVHPYFRAKEEALETEGLIQTRDTVGVDLEETLEANGKTRELPIWPAFIIRGTKYTPGG